MPSKAQHIEKAQRNEAALSRFDFDPDQYEWYLTVSFYAAVHWFRAYFSQAGLYTGEREETTYEDFPRVARNVYRAEHGSQNQPVERALTAFQALKQLSQRARYGCQTPGWYARHTGDADAALKAVREFVQGEGVQ